MSEELRSHIHSAIEAIPVPVLDQSDVNHRKQRLHRRWFMLAASGMVMSVGAAYFLSQALTGDGSTIAPTRVADSQSRDVDENALRVIKELRPAFCSSYDFYYKSEIDGESFRPVQCGMQVDIRFGPPSTKSSPALSPSPSSSPEPEVDLVSGPQLVLYSFSTASAREAWVSSHRPPLAGRIVGQDWVIDVGDRNVFRNVWAALPRDEIESVRPPETGWDLRAYVARPAADDFTPAVSLREASREIGELKEVLSAQLVIFRKDDDPRRRAVPAWMVSTRRCVPSYGGEHALPDCEGDSLHVLIDAETGERLASIIEYTLRD